MLPSQANTAWQAHRRELARKWRLLIEQPIGMLGLAIIAILALTAIFAPLLAPHDPYLQSLDGRLMAPSLTHLLGTDELGRDMLSRLIYGTRITVYIVVLVAVIATPIGLAVGTTAGYLGGWVDTVLMRVTDVFLALPGLILALGIVAALGPGIGNAVIAIALTVWPPIARLARAETLTIRHADYINAMRVQGASSFRIILRHVVPNCIPSVIVRITLNMAGIVLAAAALGFLGLGAQPPVAEWGAMLAVGRQYMSGYWWITLVPGLAILIVSLAFNLLGDALRDVFDPRQN
jgi:peptide/nickel transport system permease protein